MQKRMFVLISPFLLNACGAGMVGSSRYLCTQAGAGPGTPEWSECWTTARLEGSRFILAPRFEARLNGAPIGRYGEGLAAYNAGNYEQAYEIWLAEAEAGRPEAQNRLGLMFEYGKTTSTPRSDQMAAQWFLKSAQQGNKEAMRNLARVQLRAGQTEAARAWLAEADRK